MTPAEGLPAPEPTVDPLPGAVRAAVQAKYGPGLNFALVIIHPTGQLDYISTKSEGLDYGAVLGHMASLLGQQARAALHPELVN